jgi:Middle or third domain of peptidase_M16
MTLCLLPHSINVSVLTLPRRVDQTSCTVPMYLYVCFYLACVCEQVLSAGSLLDSQLDTALWRSFIAYFTPANTLTWSVTKAATAATADNNSSSSSSSDSSSSSGQLDTHGSLIAATTDFTADVVTLSKSDSPQGDTPLRTELHKTEKWYGVPYLSAPVNAATLRKWSETPVDSALRLPEPNPYIPDSFELVGDACELPVCVTTYTALYYDVILLSQ